MSKERKKKLRKYIITTVVGLLIGAGVMAIQGFGEAADMDRRMVILCDAFTIPGILLIMAAGLVFVSNNGALDAMGFLLSRLASVFIPGIAASQKHERYGDYVARKREKGGIKGYSFLPITGAVFLAVGVILTVIYYGMQ